MPRLDKVVIVGGGIGGLAAAVALHNSGHVARITVLESASAFEEIGAGLQLAPNALRALDVLGVADAVDSQAFYPGRLVLKDALNGELLTAVDLGESFRSRYGKPYVVIHRADLLQVLLDAASQAGDVELSSGQTVVDARSTGEGAVVRTAGGEQFDCDLVVGADGLHSAVRKVTNGDDAVVNARYVCYRATVPFEAMADTADGRNMVIWAGPRMHMVRYPVRRGTLCNLVACFESDRYTPEHDDWGTPDELDKRFAIACDQVRTGVARVERAQRWRMMDREPIQRWVYGRIALLGDAAHPMLQYVAQGACQALEDAVALGEAVGSASDLDSALAAYQGKRVPRASRVQRTARQFGEILHLGAIGASMRREVLHNRHADDYSYLDWLYAG